MRSRYRRVPRVSASASARVGSPGADSVIASLRRGRRMLIPHGDTVLQAGDVLVVVAEGQSLKIPRRLCSPDQ